MTAQDFINYKNERFVLLLVPNIMHILNHFTKQLNILKLPDLQFYKLYYTIQREPVPHYFDAVIPTFTHHYNTRQNTLQQHRTIHSFDDLYTLYRSYL